MLVEIGARAGLSPNTEGAAQFEFSKTVRRSTPFPAKPNFNFSCRWGTSSFFFGVQTAPFVLDATAQTLGFQASACFFHEPSGIMSPNCPWPVRVTRTRRCSVVNSLKTSASHNASQRSDQPVCIRPKRPDCLLLVFNSDGCLRSWREVCDGMPWKESGRVPFLRSSEGKKRTNSTLDWSSQQLGCQISCFAKERFAPKKKIWAKEIKLVKMKSGAEFSSCQFGGALFGGWCFPDVLVAADRLV